MTKSHKASFHRSAMKKIFHRKKEVDARLSEIKSLANEAERQIKKKRQTSSKEAEEH